MGNGNSMFSIVAKNAWFMCIVYSLLYIHIWSPVSYAQDAEEAETAQSSASGGILQVPVVPKEFLKKNKGLKSEKDFFEALGNNYILMEDGSVLSVSDWLLGSLRKDQSGIAMSDYERRLFLGQAARAALGLDETLVHNSLTDSGPLVPYDARPTISKPMQVLGSFVKFFIPGRDPTYRPEISGGAFHPTAKTGNTGPVLFEQDFNQYIMRVAEEFKEEGTFQNMLKDARKQLEKK